MIGARRDAARVDPPAVFCHIYKAAVDNADAMRAADTVAGASRADRELVLDYNDRRS